VDETGRTAWIEGALGRFEGPLVDYASRLLGDPHRARDAVQETFLRLVSAGPGETARLNGHLAPWLYTVCRRLCVDVLRKERRMTVAEMEALDAREGREADPAAAAETRDRAARALAAIATLPANQREVVDLRFRHHLSYAEIAAVTGLSATNVGFLLHVGLRALRARLGAQDDGGDR
jgi:RNA polymerase sigma factor (sigma-70 family)